MRIWIGMALAAGLATAFAQPADLATRLTGEWVASVEGEKRARLLTVRSVKPRKGYSGFEVDGTFVFVGERPFSLKFADAEVAGDRVVLRLTTVSDALYEFKSLADGSFQGSVTYESRQVKQARLVRPGPPELLARVAGPWTLTLERDPRTRTLVVHALAQKGDGTYSMFGNLTFSDVANPAAFGEGELQERGGELQLRLKTAANSVYALALKADGAMNGAVRFENGTSRAVTGASNGAGASARFLDTGEVGRLITGKQVFVRRFEDDRMMRLDFAAGGSFKAYWKEVEENAFNARNRWDRIVADEGTWSVDERGSLCMKWLHGGGSCADLFISRQGDRIVLQRTRAPDGPSYGIVLRVK